MAFCQVERLRTIVCIISSGFFQKAPGMGATTTILSKNCPIFGRVVSIVNDLLGLLCLMFCQCRVTEFSHVLSPAGCSFPCSTHLASHFVLRAHEGPIGATVVVPATGCAQHVRIQPRLFLRRYEHTPLPRNRLRLLGAQTRSSSCPSPPRAETFDSSFLPPRHCIILANSVQGWPPSHFV